MKIIVFQVTVNGKSDDSYSLGKQVEMVNAEMSSEEMRRAVSQIVVNLINGQRSIWTIRGSQMQTFLRMEALTRN